MAKELPNFLASVQSAEEQKALVDELLPRYKTTNKGAQQPNATIMWKQSDAQKIIQENAYRAIFSIPNAAPIDPPNSHNVTVQQALHNHESVRSKLLSDAEQNTR